MARKIIRLRDIKHYKPGELGSEFSGVVDYVLDIGEPSEENDDHIVGVAIEETNSGLPLIEGEFLVSDGVIQNAPRPAGDKDRQGIVPGDHILCTPTRETETIGPAGPLQRIVKMAFLPKLKP